MKSSFGWIGIGLGLAIAGTAIGAVKLRNERPVVVVNGEKISRSRFQTELEKEQGAGVLRRLIQEKLVLQAAQKKGVLPTPAQVQTELTQMRETEPDLDRQLRLRGKNIEELQGDLRGRLAMANLIAADVKMPDAEVKKLWSAYQKKINRPEGRKIAMVVTKSVDVGAKARGLMTAGTPAEFAAQNAGMALPGGRSQLSVYRGQLPPTLEKAVFDLKPGTVSSVLPMGQAFVVVKALEIIPAQKKSFDEAKDRLMLAAKVSKGKDQMELLQELQKSAKINFESHRYDNILDKALSTPETGNKRVAQVR